ncbi:hypothetical protein AVEN_138293-1 [Araneus ventricosus]|uniref:RNase H type-1 domain-containing protein n=1 Tax=Araneus ventricosus TaxID=182803 RepID=A0A4Y2G6B4_ARAVE|nr:hypothetical protein AVEN_138293-1 [Araneus ventricosus]
MFLNTISSDETGRNNHVELPRSRFYLEKNIGKEQPQVEKCNTIKKRDGTVVRDDGQAANILGLHYQNISKLTFIGEDRHIRSRASDIIHGCRSNTQDSIPIFNRDFTLQELEAAIADSKLNKSPGPDGIHGKIINKLGSIGRLRFLDIINGSWKIGRLPRDWRRAIVVPIRNPCKDAGAPESFRPIALTSLTQSIDPSVGLPGIFFHTNFPVQVNKQKDHPTYLRQLALEIINDIPVDAVKVYTDDSKNDSDCTGSGIYITTHNQELKVQRRNPDFCTVFRSELIAIDEGLDSLSSFSCSNEIWILTDSRSSIQHLANLHRVRDNTVMNVLNKLKSLSVSYLIHLQWIPSLVNIQGNEITDALAKAGADDASVTSAPLTYLELFSRAKSRNITIWLIPLEHHWYQGSRSGGCLSIYCSRRDQTTLTRFLSGYIRNLTFSDNSECFEICPKCTAEQATPDHILACLGLSQKDLVSNPLLALDFFRVHRLMDLI